MAGPEAPHAFTVVLQMFAVELSGIDLDPQFINPATLQFNGVVDKDWICENGIRIGITESNFSYTNGVQVEASDETVCFRHSGIELAEGSALSAELAKRYAVGFDDDNWFGISLEFGGVIVLSGDPTPASVSVWSSFVDRLTHHGVSPRFHTSAFYNYPDRRLVVELFQNPGSSHTPLGCVARIHRHLEYSQQVETEHRLESVLSSWRSDWKDAVAAITRLADAALPSESL